MDGIQSVCSIKFSYKFKNYWIPESIIACLSIAVSVDFSVCVKH